MNRFKFKYLVTWQFYAYYGILTLAVFFIHHLTDIWGVEALVTNRFWYGWPALYGFYVIGILVVDSILGMISEKLPQKWRVNKE